MAAWLRKLLGRDWLETLSHDQELGVVLRATVMIRMYSPVGTSEREKKKWCLFLIYKKATSKLPVALCRHLGPSDLIIFRVKSSPANTSGLFGKLPSQEPSEVEANARISSTPNSTLRHASPGSSPPWNDFKLKLWASTLFFFFLFFFCS